MSTPTNPYPLADGATTNPSAPDATYSVVSPGSTVTDAPAQRPIRKRWLILGGLGLFLLGVGVGASGSSSDTSTTAAPGTVTVTASAEAGETAMAAAAAETEEPAAEAPAAEGFTPGLKLVGVDIEPGTYRSEGGSLCYWERLSGLTGEFSDIITNDAGGIDPVVQILDTDVAFESTRCGDWVRLN